MSGDKTPDWLRQRALISPDKQSLIFGADRWTFQQLDQITTQTAHRLGELGIASGDCVALMLRNTPEFVVLVHAISRLGAILVPINTRLSPDEISWQLADVGARLLTFDASYAPSAQQAASSLPDLMTLPMEELFQVPSATVPLQENFDLSAVQTILYTSGTTGQPKGATLTYGNHWWSTVASALNLGLYESDRWLICLPLFHVGGLSILYKSVIYGIPAILHDSFDPVAVNREIDTGNATIVSAVSIMLQRMLDARAISSSETETVYRPYQSTLRCILLGGGPAPQKLLESCAKYDLPVVQTYGLTEAASQVATLSPQDALRKLGSAGKPLMPTELRIVLDDRTALNGEEGEIVVRGPTVTPGYVNRPDATARALRDGWLYTGDWGYLDQEGYLFVLDRRDDLIISGGENVYPAEIESVLMSHPAVEDAGVIGMADEQWGQIPVAAIKTRPDRPLNEKQLQTYCQKRLAKYKVPVHIWFLDALPRNANGKLSRKILAEQLVSYMDAVEEDSEA